MPTSRRRAGYSGRSSAIASRRACGVSDRGLPERLFPIFRDRNELASGSDLGEAVTRALSNSDALIVICSPASAASRWVNEEIRTFRRVSPACEILCMIVDGRPHADAADCAFPPALLADDEGQPLPEPLAADLRPQGDGKRGAFLKIAAGLLGVGIDALRQRDQQRKLRVMTAVTAGAVLIAVVTIALAIRAERARQEADLRRSQAENLIEFMLVELRGRLEPIGRLEILDSVGDEAMAYFGALGGLGTDDEVLARAMALRQIGEVRFGQGKLAPALDAFVESRQVIQALHEQSPDEDRISFELGQSEFWVGYVGWERNDLDMADAAFRRYHEISESLLERQPDNLDYRLELSYAASNLGSLARERGATEDAQAYFSEAVRLGYELVESQPDNLGYQYDLAEGLSWLGSAELDLRRLVDSERHFEDAVDILAALHGLAVRARHSEAYGDVLVLAAESNAHRGRMDQAVARAQEATDVFAALVDRDEENARWRTGLVRALRFKAQMSYVQGDLPTATQSLSAARAHLEALTADDPSNTILLQRLARVLALQARVDQLSQSTASAESVAAAMAARALSDRALDTGAGSNIQRRMAVEVRSMQGEVLAAVGDSAGAQSAWLDAASLLTPDALSDPVMLALHRRVSLWLGRREDASLAAAELAAVGFLDPRY